MLILTSALMSSAEIALFSLSRFQIRSFKEQFPSAHRKIKRLLADPGGLLIVILVINEIVNIAVAAIITGAIAGTDSFIQRIFSHWLPRWLVDATLGMLVTAPIILISCEITPKVIGARVNRIIALLTATPLHFIYEVAYPVRSFLKRLVNWISRQSTPSSAPLNESEFIFMAEEANREGSLQQNELELIKNVFELDNTLVSEVFTPLQKIQMFDVTMTLSEALKRLRNQQFSRIPVSSTDRKRILGILYAKDLLRVKLEPELGSRTVEDLMRKPLLAPPSMRLNALFRKFKQRKTHLAVVQEPHTETLGIITLSDVMDVLFEDLFEDHHEEEDYS